MGKVIKVNNISKAYQLGDFSTGTISQDVERFIAKIRDKEDPFLKIGETNDRSKKGESDIVWSLKDINFEIEKGDAVGIIGKNGAGKSTLLKILSRVTSPTSGNIKVKGRIASLLEVGTGFHPELTGRENIFLNGAILGMRKAEIKRKFDEIVDFSGIERYVDTPVKRYSSGMYVRLAFAVAAHLESEILIVDEVLAVGDAEFQKKCLGKMGDISKGEGRTILFVSHNMGLITQLCKYGILLNNGILEYHDTINNVLGKYISSNNMENVYENKIPRLESYYSSIFLHKKESLEITNIFLFNEDILINISIMMRDYIKNLTLSIIVKDMYDVALFSSHYNIPDEAQLKAVLNIQVIIPNKTLIPSQYKLEPLLHIPNVRFVDNLSSELSFEVEDSGSKYSYYKGAKIGNLVIPVKWKLL